MPAAAFKPVFQEYLLSTTLDQLVGEYQLPPPQHVKIDVDGLELEILSGGSQVLRSGAVESLFFEIGGRFDMGEVTALLLDNCGFEQKAIFRHDNTSNVIFVRKQPGR